jgi:hypothetical protein
MRVTRSWQTSWRRIEEEVGRRIKKKAEDFEISESSISGLGIQATRDLDAGALIGQAIEIVGQDAHGRDLLWTTPVGRYMNYSREPNIELRPGAGGYDMYTTKDIKDGEEFTASWKYRKEHATMGSPHDAVLLNGTVPGTDSTKPSDEH